MRSCVSSASSTTLKLLFVGFWYLTSFVSTGIIFGWISLHELLTEEGVYGWLCHSQDPHTVCAAQRARLASVFIAGSTALTFSFFSSGLVVDNKGPRASIVPSLAISSLGSCLLATADHWAEGAPFLLDGYALGYMALGYGGAGVHISILHVSNVFSGSSRIAVLTLFSAIYTFSSSLFLVFRFLVQRGGVSFRVLFVLLSVFQMGCCIISCLLMPNAKFADDVCCTPQQTDDDSLLHEDVEMSSSVDVHVHVAETSAAMNNDHTFDRLPFRQQLFTPAYVCICLYFMLHLLRAQVYMASLPLQLLAFGNVSYYTTIFALMFPCGGLISPFLSRLLAKFGFIPSSVFVNVAGTVAFLCLCFPSAPWLVVVSFLFFAIFRMSLLGSFYSGISSFFGWKTYGHLTGFAQLLAAAFCLLQFLFIYLGSEVFDGNYLMVNVVMMILCLPLHFGKYFMHRRTMNAVKD